MFGLHLFFLIDGKIGGNVISYTEALLDAYGVSERSGEARLTGITYQQRSAVGGVEVMLPVPGIVMPDGEITSVQGGVEPVLIQSSQIQCLGSNSA